MELERKNLRGVVVACAILLIFLTGFSAGNSGIFSRQTFDECMEKGLRDLPFKSLSRTFVECKGKNGEDMGDTVAHKWRVACYLYLDKPGGDTRWARRYCGRPTLGGIVDVDDEVHNLQIQ